MKAQLVYISCLLLIACKSPNAGRSSDNSMTLYYDLYRHDSLIKKNAVTIEYQGRNTSLVTISGLDTGRVVFKQKVTEYGIFRSSESSEYYLTHFFNARSSIENFLPFKQPVFANSVSSLYKKKQYAFGSNDSLEVLFFEEAIPAYTYTNSYFSKRLGLFIIYYNTREDYYYVLSSGSGLQLQVDSLLKVEKQIVNDTLFFGKFLKGKLPNTPPPPSQTIKANSKAP